MDHPKPHQQCIHLFESIKIDWPVTITCKEVSVFPEYKFVEGQTMDNVQKMGTMKRNLREGTEVAYEKWIYII